MLKKFFLPIVIIIVFVSFFYALNIYLKKNIKSTNLYGSIITKEGSEDTIFQKIEKDKNSWRRDPFNNQKANYKETTIKNLFDEEIDINVEAIVIGDKNYAIVNGKIIRVGDKIGRYKVDAIQKHKLIFNKEGIKKEVFIY